MMKSSLRILACLFFVLSPLFLLAQPQGEHIILKNVRLLDGVSNEIKTGLTVVIKNGRIAEIGESDRQVSSKAIVVDLQNYYLLPGLIDAHAHVDNLDNARRALAYGTTTLRSASVGSYADVAIQRLVSTGKIAGPEIVPAGVFVQPDLGNSVLADPRLAELYGGVETEEALRRLVQINIENGVKVIKTRSAERAGTPDTDPRKQVYTEEQLGIIVDEAKKGGIPVMTHAHGSVAPAVRAGVRSIEHGTYASRPTLELMKERNTYLVPTYSTVIDLTEPGGDYDHPVTTIRGKHMLPQMQEMLRQAMDVGVDIVASTDSGYGPESVNRVSTEVVNFTKLGMDPFAAIQSATITAAELLQISDRTGSVEVGKEADLIVVFDNPLEDIRSIQDVIMVISNGKIVHNRLPFEAAAEKGEESR